MVLKAHAELGNRAEGDLQVVSPLAPAQMAVQQSELILF